MQTPEQIIRKLGAAQRRAIIALPVEGFGPSGEQAAAIRLWYRGDIPPLLDHAHRSNDSWRLRPIGVTVRALLLRAQGSLSR